MSRWPGLTPAWLQINVSNQFQVDIWNVWIRVSQFRHTCYQICSPLKALWSLAKHVAPQQSHQIFIRSITSGLETDVLKGKSCHRGARTTVLSRCSVMATQKFSNLIQVPIDLRPKTKRSSVHLKRFAQTRYFNPKHTVKLCKQDERKPFWYSPLLIERQRKHIEAWWCDDPTIRKRLAYNNVTALTCIKSTETWSRSKSRHPIEWQKMRVESGWFWYYLQ